MKTNLAVVVATASSVAAQKPSYASLNPADQSLIHAKLSKWKTLYGPLAKTHGFLPPSTQESLDPNQHTAAELDRFHTTILNVEEAAKDNPLATFSEFNQFALLTTAEFKRAVMKSFGGRNHTATTSLAATASAASTMDWSTSKCNPPVQNQGQCGSCWAFSTVGTAEFAHCLATGELLSLSEQQVVSCDSHSYGCDGGFPAGAIDYMAQTGVCLSADYPYTSGKSGNSGSCNSSCSKRQLSLGATQQISGESSLLTVLNTQPVTVVVEAGNPVWQNYHSGVVTQCPGAQSDHAVIAVGYGTSTGDFWKIKNSWGAQWGENGYIYLQRGVGGRGMCNVAEGISYPKLDGSPGPTSNQPPAPSSITPAPYTNRPTNSPTPVPMSTIPTQAPKTTRSTLQPTKKPTPSTKRPQPSTKKPQPSISTPPPSPKTSVYTSTPPSPPSGNSMQDQLIAQTNKIRAAHGLSPVTWDATLATKMQSWAASCPGFQHGGPSGWQNLATNTPCGSGKKDCNSIVGAAWMWYDQEETKWNYDSNQCNGGWAT
ncbi:hypothetical protein As57867_004503, partial [Aphanomyces stellatus]